VERAEIRRFQEKEGEEPAKYQLALLALKKEVVVVIMRKVPRNPLRRINT